LDYESLAELALVSFFAAAMEAAAMEYRRAPLFRARTGTNVKRREFIVANSETYMVDRDLGKSGQPPSQR
jgi:hypothetical protein